MSAPSLIDRPPRILPELPQGEVEVPTPPDSPLDASQLLMHLALPLLTVVGYLFMASQGQGRNALMVVPMAITMVASGGLALYSYTRSRRELQERRAAYARRLGELRRDLLAAHDQQRRFYQYCYPDSGLILRIAHDLDPDRPPAQRREDLRSGTRIWERRPDNIDFGHVRLGMGTVASTVHYQLSRGENFNSPQMRDAQRLADDARWVSGIPVGIPLRRPAEAGEAGAKVRPVPHALGIAGEDLVRVHDFARALVVHFAAMHSPLDTRVHLVGLSPHRKQWEWARSLPHCASRQPHASMCFDDRLDSEDHTSPVNQFWRGLRQTLERRRQQLMEKDSLRADVSLPFLLVVVDLWGGADRASALADVEGDAAVALILQDGLRLGAAIAFIVSDRSKVPGGCGAVIEVDSPAGSRTPPVFRYAEIGLNSPRYTGDADQVSAELAEGFAARLNSRAVRSTSGSDLATNVTLLEMLGIASVNSLQQQVQSNWERSLQPDQADWLSVPVGQLAGNEVRSLVLSAKADGVHGMIAGSTGSGKSELLMTFIMGLAINYDPSVVNFVLVDYKGGAAFEPFRSLPHVVDIVTNLEASATARMFAAIKAELDRRQKLNTNNGVKDIVDYRRKGLPAVNPSPYPFLFIVIDEFAEMIAGNAEFKSQLESITRLGRALGVHLVLAAQRPAGVTDQMRANIKFRICLRVETPDDSQEVLRRRDAAFLPPGIPGRGFLQVGNENIEQIQVAHTGGDYSGPLQENAAPPVRWLNRSRKRAAGDDAPKLYEVVIRMLAQIAVDRKVPAQWRPWPRYLPDALLLETPLENEYINEQAEAQLRLTQSSEAAAEPAPLILSPRLGEWRAGGQDWPVAAAQSYDQYALRPVIGLVDDPFGARQFPLQVNLRDGHALVVGASGSGKTSFLKTLLTCLALNHSPAEMHVYILDFGGRSLTLLADLPHLGALINTEEQERVHRLIRRLASLVEERQKKLNGSNLYDHNRKAPAADRLPSIVVVVDNFAEFKEGYESLLAPLTALAREGRNAGLHWIFTADGVNALPGTLFNLVTERFALRLPDASDYAAVVGRASVNLRETPGRGLVRVNRAPLEFQAAHVGEPGGDDDAGGSLAELVAEMRTVWASRQGGRPPGIGTLPSYVSLVDLSREAPAAPPGGILLGLDDLRLAPAWVDLRQNPHFVVIGPPNSGKTTALRTLVAALAQRRAPAEALIVLVDMQARLHHYGGARSLAELPHVVEVVSSPEAFQALPANLAEEAQVLAQSQRGGEPRREIFVVIDNYDSLPGDGAAFEALGRLARERGTAGLHFVLCGSMAIASSTDELRRQALFSNYGLALQSPEAAGKLNGRVLRLGDAELPMGRAFLVKSGRTTMLQVAAPFSDPEATEAGMDDFVTGLLQQYSGQPRRVWTRPPEAPAPPAPARPVLSDGQWLELRERLGGSLTPELVAGLPNDELLALAAEYQIDVAQLPGRD